MNVTRPLGITFPYSGATLAVHLTGVLEPAMVELDVQAREVFEPAIPTISPKFPEDGLLFASPPYMALIVTGEVGSLGVYPTEHDPFAREQVPAVKLPEPPVDQLTLPVGEEPLTLALHVVILDIVTELGLQTTLVTVGETLTTTSPIMLE
jgi:hypothetical protein